MVILAFDKINYNMLISEHFENSRRVFLKGLEEKRTKAISIIRNFVKRHKDEGLFVPGSGIQVYDYMDDNLSICFYHDGMGDCEQFYEVKYDFDPYTGEPTIPIPKFSPYELTDYSSRNYELALYEYGTWCSNQYRLWALKVWQEAKVVDQIPFAFFDDYYQAFNFDLLQMQHVDYDNYSKVPLGKTLLSEELLMRIGSNNFHHLFLKKDQLYLEIGYLFQPKFKLAFERQYENGEWTYKEKIGGKQGSVKDVRNFAGQFLRKAIKSGFEIVDLPESIPFEKHFDFIFPGKLSHAKNHWGEQPNIEVQQFETQLNIKLPSDYRAFLEQYNGLQSHAYDGFGYTKYDSIRPVIFYGLSYKPSYDIVHHIEKLEYKCLPEYIPIGEDMEYNQIWLGVSEEKKGQVVYKRFEAPQKKIVTYEIDSSFQEFVDGFFTDFNAGIEHIVAANELNYFKKYLQKQWNWDDSIRWSRDVMDVIMRADEPRPAFLDFAFSQGRRVDRVLRNGYNMTPEIIAVFDKHQITIPKMCLSYRLQSILKSGKPLNEKEFSGLIEKGADPNLFEVYETLQKWIETDSTPNRLEMLEKIKPYYRKLSSTERIDLIVDQRGLSFSSNQSTVAEFELSGIDAISNIPFPDGLMEFLKKYQGTVPNLRFFEFTISAGNDNHFVEIDHVLGPSEMVTNYAFTKDILTKKEITDRYLPIAITKDGGYVVINCEKESKQYGSLGFIFNHIIRYDRHRGHQAYRFKKTVATDIFQFLMKLLPKQYVFDEMSLEAQKGNLDYFKMRLERGWNINVFTRTEQTSLHQAVRNNHHRLAKFLLDNGANPNLKVASPDWDSTLSIAIKYADEAMVQLIYQHSDLTYTDDYERLKSYLIKYYGKAYLRKF